MPTLPPQLKNDMELRDAISAEGVHVLSYLLPAGLLAAVPEQLVNLLHTCKCPVLIYKKE